MGQTLIFTLEHLSVTHSYVHTAVGGWTSVV